MEDTHIASTNLPNKVSVFGVFDGHGGTFVSKFVKEKFIDTLKNNKNFKEKNYK